MDGKGDFTTGEVTLCGTFQITFKNDMSKHARKFDDCKVTSVKLFLNVQYYQYDNLNCLL